MKKHIFPAALLAVGLFFLTLPLEASGLGEKALVLEEQDCLTAAPFFTGYRMDGAPGSELGELYHLSWDQTQIHAYRTQPGAAATGGEYSLSNLEDTSEVAGTLRAVLSAGYPRQKTDALEAQANIWLRARGKPEIENLQSGEALLATQIAVWKLICSGSVTFPRVYSGRKDLTTPSWSGYRQKLSSQAMLTQQATEATEQNILSLCDYLLGLAPKASSRVLASDAALKYASYSLLTEDSGSCTVHVQLPLELELREEDELVLQAVCGNQRKKLAIHQPGTYEFTFSGLTQPQAVSLTLDGIQRGEDVYFYKGDHSLLVGYSDGPVPVQGQVTLTPDRILRIRKTADAQSGGKPLSNIQFNLYLAATREQLDRGEAVLSQSPTAAEIASCRRPENLVAILSTDQDGVAEFNFTAGGHPDGVYLVVEQFCAATTGPVDPFYITIPQEDTYLSEIHLENTTETQPDLTVSVTEQGRSEDSFSLGEPQTWILRGSIPAGMASARSYIIIDTLPGSLSYEQDSLTVTLTARDGKRISLAPNTHYEFSRNQQTLEIRLTPAGMAYAAANRGEGTEREAIEVSFRSTITGQAPLGDPISNRARLEYTNGADIAYSKTSSPSRIYTGGLALRKVDASGKPLCGIRFRLARDARPGEGQTHILQVGQEQKQVVYLSFCPDRDFSREPVTEVSTDENGRACLSGLAFGSYYLVEQSQREAPVPVVIHAESHLDGTDGTQDNALVLVTDRALLPDTGSIGAAALTFLGFAACVCAVSILMATRKEEF